MKKKIIAIGSMGPNVNTDITDKRLFVSVNTDEEKRMTLQIPNFMREGKRTNRSRYIVTEQKDWEVVKDLVELLDFVLSLDEEPDRSIIKYKIEFHEGGKAKSYTGMKESNCK